VTFSDHISQSVSTLGPERPVFGDIGTTLRQGRLPWPSGGHAQHTRQLAASTRRWPYPTHWVTGAPAACRHSSDRAPRPGVFQRPGNRHIRPTRLRNFSQFGNYTATGQPPHMTRQPTRLPQPGYCHTATSRPKRLRNFSHFYQRTPHYIILPVHTAPHHRPEQTVLFRAPQTLQSGLSNRRTSHNCNIFF
jgi:hypothetical protein